MRRALALSALLISCAAAPPDSRRPGAAPTAALAVQAAVVAPPSADPPKLRLPDVAFPLRYEAELTLDPAKPSFSGVLSIHLGARRPTRIVWLHAEELAARLRPRAWKRS